MNTFSPQEARQRGEEQHMEAQLLELALGNWTPEPAEVEQLLAHLERCEFCQVLLGTLVAAEAREKDSEDPAQARAEQVLERLAQARSERHVRDELPAYLEALEMDGEAAARARYPAQAAHLARCAACRADLEASQALLHAAQQAGLIAPLAPPALVTATSPWQEVAEGLARLRENLRLRVGQATLTLEHLASGLLRQELVAGYPIMATPEATIGHEERLIVTVPVQVAGAAAPPYVWLRVRLDLRAQYDRQMMVHLYSERIETPEPGAPDPDASGTPWAGVAWQAEHLEGTLRREAGLGATNDAGAARFGLARSGTYELSLTVGQQTWQLPLQIQHV